MFKNIHYTALDTAKIMKQDGWWLPITYVAMFLSLIIYLIFKGVKKCLTKMKNMIK